MVNRKKLILTALTLGAMAAHAAAGENKNPVTESVSAYRQDTVSLDTIPARKGFFGRIIDYFSDSNEDKSTHKKVDFSVIGGPHYSSETKFGIGLVAAGLYRTDRSDTLSAPSNVSFVGDFSTTGFWFLGIRGNTFFQRSKYRIDYNTYFYSMPTKIWGIGYDMGRNDNNVAEYKLLQTQFKVDFMYRLASNLYIGANAGFFYNAGKKFDDWFHDGYYLRGQKREYANTGIGAFLLYDSRDYITAPHKGWYFKLDNMLFPRFMGNKPDFNRLEFTLNYYHRIWEGGVMAYDLHGMYHSGDVPWPMMALLGNSRRMRGYYEGRYRDKGIMEVQAELRQKVWRRIGFVVWGGAGNVFPKFSEIDMSHTLPNYGVGLRWEFKNRVNVRFDFGMGKGQSGFVFNINEAF